MRRPAAVAVLHAMTMILTSCSASHLPACNTKERTSSSGRLARTRGGDGGACARRDHTDHRRGQHLLSDAQTRRGGGVARDDHDLDLVLGEPPARLQHKGAHLLLGTHVTPITGTGSTC